MNISDHTLDALLDHLRDWDLPTILARLADRSEPYVIVVVLVGSRAVWCQMYLHQCINNLYKKSITA